MAPRIPSARRARTARVVLAGLLLVATTAAGAQAPAPLRTVDDEPAAWLAFLGLHPLSARWRLQLEAQLRQTEGVRQPQQRLYRTALLRVLGPRLRVGGGYALVRTYPPDEFVADPVPFTEHRAHQQLDLGMAAGPVAIDHRYRLEQRFVERLGAGADRARRVGWTYTNRARYLLRATLAPGGGAPTAGEPYLTAYDELFVGFGRNVRNNVFDQNRAFVGVGYRWSPVLRAEVGYQNHYVLRATGTQAERNHTLLTTVFSEVPLRR